MTLRSRLLSEALCNFTPAIVGGKCGDCGAKLKETDDVFWFSDGRESGEGKYIGRCCLERHIT